MSIVWVCTVIINVISLAFLGISLIRVFSYMRRNTFIETRYTMLFGFIQMKHLIFVYMMSVLVFMGGSFLFVSYLSSL